MQSCNSSKYYGDVRHYPVKKNKKNTGRVFSAITRQPHSTPVKVLTGIQELSASDYTGKFGVLLIFHKGTPHTFVILERERQNELSWKQ